MSAIRAWQVIEKGEGARLLNLEPRPLAAGEIRVRVEASSLNYKDALAVTGKGRIMRRFPCIAGVDIAGEITESAAEQWQVGESILVTGSTVGEVLDGGLTTEVVIPGEIALERPVGLTALEVMAYGTAGFTAGLAVQRMLDNNQTPELGPIAVTGSTGGVGSVAIALLAKLGYEVIAVTTKTQQAEYLKALGAADLLNAREIEPASAPLLKERWGGVVDNVGGPLLATLIAETHFWGNVASIGLAASHKLDTTVMPFILRGVNLLGIHSVETPMPLRRQVWERLLGEWRVDSDLWHKATISLDEVGEACAEIAAGGVTGRYVVDCTR